MEKKVAKEVEEFAQKVLQGESTFEIPTGSMFGNKVFAFFQKNVGKGRFVYGTYFYENGLPDIMEKYSLIAVVSEEKIYMWDDRMFRLYNHVMPSYIEEVPFEKANLDAKTIFFSNYIDGLKTHSIEDDSQKDKLLKRCRKLLLEGIENDEVCFEGDMYSEQEVIASLCGVVDLEKLALEKLQEQQDKWIARKSQVVFVNEAIRSQENVEPWEMDLAEAIRNVDAVFLKVEFELNGKRQEGKMKKDTILRNLYLKERFSDGDFDTIVAGARILKSLGASDSYYSGIGLTCENITSISYRKTQLYKKNE